MIFEIDESKNEPIYKQIQQQIILAIAQQDIFPGDNLPSIRQLSDELSINPMTISKAYSLLKEDGYLQTDRRKGAIITRPDTFTDATKKRYLENLALVIADGFLHHEENDQIIADVKKILTQYEKESE